MFSLWAALYGLARGRRSEEHFTLDQETSPPKPFTFKQSHYLSQQASDFIILSLAGEQSASCLEQTGALEVNTARSSLRPLKSACRLFLCDLWPEVLHKQREARLTLMLISCNKSCRRELYNKTIRKHDGDDDGCKQQPVRIWKLRGKLDSPVQLLMTINGRTGRPIGFLAAVRWEVVSLHEVNAEFPYRLHIYHSDMLHQRCRAPGGHDPHWEDASEHWACQHHNLDSGGPRWISIFLLLWLVSYL